MLRKAFWTLALLGAASFTGCMKYEDDSIQYAAEFYVDEFGRPLKGQPQYELAVVIKDDQGNSYAHLPPADGAAGAEYDPKASDRLDLLSNSDKKSGRHFMFDMSDHPIAHLNPHRAYSPFKTGGKFVELNTGKKGPGPNFDRKNKRFYRIVPKEAPCWRCGGTNEITTFGPAEECPDCDDSGFVTYYGVRLLDDHFGKDVPKEVAGKSRARVAKRAK
ncbi:MAG: hypothetical protein P1V97_18605 [Planctomycetota bacterium]|nr:hypothetical protein [Planctomycetota bacterium]